jgi:hypothetical protein
MVTNSLLKIKINLNIGKYLFRPPAYVNREMVDAVLIWLGLALDALDELWVDGIVVGLRIQIPMLVEPQGRNVPQGDGARSVNASQILALWRHFHGQDITLQVRVAVLNIGN